MPSPRATAAVIALLVVMAGATPAAAQHATTGSLAGSVAGPGGDPRRMADARGL